MTTDTDIKIEELDNPFDMLVISCQLLGWDIALQKLDDEDELTGVVVGTPDFIQDTILELDDFEIYSNEEEI